MSEQLLIQAGQAMLGDRLNTNRLERTTLDGRSYAVAPVVALIEGVRNGLLVTAAVIGKYVEAWNGRAVPLRHPMRNGEYVSANSPEVVGAEVVGTTFNFRMDGERLVGELWIDEAKASGIPDAKKTLARLDAGDVVEVSTAFWADDDELSGEWNGMAFAGAVYNLHPDHVALLPDQIGACSVAQGCGAPRVNVDDGAELITNQQDGVMVAFFLRDEDAARWSWAGRELPAGSHALPTNELHVTLAYLGTVDEVGAYTSEDRLLHSLMEIAEHQVLMPAAINGIGRFNSADGVEPIILLVDSQALTVFRHWLVEELGWQAPVDKTHGFTPHITVAYIPAGEVVEMAVPPRGDVIFDALALAWGGRQTIFKLQGELRQAAEPAVADGSADGLAVNSMEDEMEKSIVGDVKVEKKAAADEKFVAQPTEAPEVAELVALVRSMGGVEGLGKALQAMQANTNAQRAGLVAALGANPLCKFSSDDLAALPVEALIKLDLSLKGAVGAVADYSGAGGVRVHEQSSEWRAYAAPKAAAVGAKQ
ncbi:MAG: 2'-5' RNA ligase family protein [Cypionkella sp.]